jgi:Domain of unknown function (DUF4349)
MSPELAEQLRAARPVASPGLRERVLAVAAEPAPAPRRRLEWPLRRIALVAVPGALAVALAVAGVHGIVSSGGARQNASSPPVESAGSKAGVAPSRMLQRTPALVPTTTGRLQQYGATLRVQVKNRDELSNATKRAMRFARLLGGYVASVHYSAPHSGQGSAAIVVRVPVDRVQDAIEEYSGLGTLLNQRVTITDVTKAVQEEAKEIARIRGEIAAIEQGGVSSDERPRLEALQARLDYLTKRRKATVRRAELARISLGLVTKSKEAASASRFHRTLNDAGGVLVRELELLAYALIVAGPLLLLGGAVIAAGRLRDRRLFERS